MGARPIIGFVLAVAAITALLFAPSFNDGGPEMDEGTLVAYPALVTEGLVPGRDFETFYGPAQPYLSAAAATAFGHSVTLERIAGLAMRTAIALAIFFLVLPLGRWLALAAAVAADLILLGLGLQALAILGSVAATLVALALIARRPQPRAWLPFAAAGLTAAAAICFRPDMAPAVVLGTAPLVVLPAAGRWFDRSSLAFYAALALGLIPLVAWLAVVGTDGIDRIVSDLAASREGRRLPLPGIGSTEGQILLAAVTITALNVLASVGLLNRDGFDGRGRLLASVSLVLILLIPSALQRADAAHILPFAAVAIGLLPLTIDALIRIGVSTSWAKGALGLCALLVVVGFTHQAGGALRSQLRSVGEGANSVRIGDRSFPIDDPHAAADLQRILTDLDRVARPGDSVFFGPTDLSRTNYADTFAYYLLPDLRPASFYTEVNPGTANAGDSSLPTDLRDADFIVLSSRWNTSDTDAAARPGSVAATRVVESDFCVGSRAGSYVLYERCDPGRSKLK